MPLSVCPFCGVYSIRPPLCLQIYAIPYKQIAKLKKNEIKQSKTGYGEQVWCLRALSTISRVLDRYIPMHMELQKLYPAPPPF